MTKDYFHFTITKISNGYLLTDEEETMLSLKQKYVKEETELLQEILKKIDNYRFGHAKVKIEVV